MAGPQSDAEEVSQTPDKRDFQAAYGQRVYEYQDDQGIIYWSFSQAPNIISPPKRLQMKSRIGVHLVNFLTRLRRKSEQFQSDGGSDG